MTDRPADEVVDVLLVEDNPGDVRLTREAFDEAAIDVRLHVVTDGEEALSFLDQRDAYDDAPRPAVVLLDLNLPKVDGLDVLETIKADTELRAIPVIVLTGSTAEEDVAESYERHTNAYLTKPVDPEEFVSLVRTFGDFWIDQVQLPPEP